jgi:hypothetical protein
MIRRKDRHVMGCCKGVCMVSWARGCDGHFTDTGLHLFVFIAVQFTLGNTSRYLHMGWR